MSDIFNEQLVERKPNQKDVIKKAGLIGLAIIIAFVDLVFMPSVLLLVLAVEVMGLVFLFRRMNAEFEYVITNTELDINKILNKSSRKKLYSLNVKDITAMVPAMKKEYHHEVSKFNKKIDCSSGDLLENTYIMIFRNKEDFVQMTFEPNEKMLKSIRTFIPNIVRK